MKSKGVKSIKNPEKKATRPGPFPIVAIGASAGGLEAITTLLKYLSPDIGMAFIYVQHLSPDHKSMLTSLLSKETSLKVQEIDKNVLIQPNAFFIMPPDKEIKIVKDYIVLTPRPQKPKVNLPIDLLFTSLAKAHKQNTIGIILSGSASDGTIGMKSIKSKGGLTFAQDKTAAFASMPKSAIAAGVVDYILSPKEIALELNRLSTHPHAATFETKGKKEDLIKSSNPDLQNILKLLLEETNVDFNAYKVNTIKRRILRRMQLYKLETPKQYLKLIHEKKEELDILYQDLLIGVTSFFRDLDTYKYLKSTLLPRLLKSKSAGDVLRIWIPACSTGEEAFSIAMMIIELQDNTDKAIPVQIFATDINEKVIRKARIGLFAKNEVETISPKRLQRFFSKTHEGYRVTKIIRNMCVFAQHNILADAPFSNIDFISCRNLFIYLDAPAQKRALATFHYALRDGGYIMLGKAEAIGSSIQFFHEVQKKYKIFVRKERAGGRKLPELSPRKPVVLEEGKISALKRKSLPSDRQSKSVVAGLDLYKMIDDVLVSEVLPPSVVINQQMEILQFRGSMDLFLTHPQGKATLHILKMARPEIAFALRTSILKAIKTNLRVRKNDIEVKARDGIRTLGIDVVPLHLDWEEPLLVVLFTEHAFQKESIQQGGGNKSNSQAKDRRIKKLEEELVAAQADALVYAQEYETFTQELQSVNEEIVSSNEELQTLNEELETSKEEIESINEELTTTNQELQTRNDLLNESYDYSKAIISTLHEPLIILDKDLRVKTANKSFYQVFKVNEEDTEGKMLYDLGNRQWNIPRLRELLEDIVPKNSFFYDYRVTHTFQGIGKKVLMLNASRIVQKSHGTQLILLSIHDITESVRQQVKEKASLKRDVRESKTYNLELKKAVEDQTKKLHEANNSLAEKIDELERMNKELESFAYVSSHDLQEPLRKIQIFAGRILDLESKNLSERGKNYFRLMRNSAERMQTLIRDLLAFSHVSLSNTHFERVELKKITEEVISEFKERIEETHAIIEDKSKCEIYVIPFQFRQVLQNLISNALKFSKPETPPHITITCNRLTYNKANAKRLPAQKDFFHICFSDNGIGFENKFSEKVFEVFEKLHGKDEYAGTGIGLAIVKKIVENHNGRITVKSVLNKGTIFDIYIPAI